MAQKNYVKAMQKRDTFAKSGCKENNDEKSILGNMCEST